ncbi:hypothetical protein YC2023_062642 [Brassica napus]
MDSIDTGASDGAAKAPSKSLNDGDHVGYIFTTIGSVAKSDDYRRVLADPLYTMIRQALYYTDETCQANEFRSQEGRGCEEI